MELNSLGFLFLRRGWKLCALAQGLQEVHVLHFKFDDAAMLFVKVFGSAGGHVDYCMEGGRSNPSGTNDSGYNSSFGGSDGDNNSNGSPGAYVNEKEYSG
ncbi:hypothetical protein D1007_58202 [Hordeum vulgare]|nr:hypothetical protein D1007_58202 [Hordeum vulgare]